MDKSSYIYYVISFFDGIVGLTVTDGDYFDKNSCQSDWTPNGAEEELERLGFHAGEEMEGFLSFYDEVNTDDVKEKLASSPLFKFSPEFQSYIEKREGGMSHIIPV